MPSPIFEDVKDNGANSAVMEDRKYMVDACIVRTMKTRNRMDHQVGEERRHFFYVLILGGVGGAGRICLIPATLILTPPQALLAEVVLQVRYFVPDVKLVKQRIEAMISQTYIRRESPDSHLSPYMYVSRQGWILPLRPSPLVIIANGRVLF